MRREDCARILSQITVGTFILCLDRAECRWIVYKAQLAGSDFHSRERGVVFTGEPYWLPDELSPIRYWGCHYTLQSSRYDFNIDAIDCDAVDAIFANEADMLTVAEQLRDQEQQYVDATAVYRDRFGVFATLVTT